MTEPRSTIYRFITGPDDASFCHRVSKALSEGWQLHGAPSYAYDAATGEMRCGQAVTKQTAEAYDPERKLGSY